MWFYSTVFWLFYHSTFFNCFIFKLIHPLNIACLAGCLFLFFFFGVFFLLRFIKRSDSATQKLNWEQQRKRWGRGQGEKAGRKNRLQSTPRDFEMPHPVLWKEKFGLHMIWHVLKSDVSQQTVAPKICCLWLFINLFLCVYQSSLLTI